MRTRGPIAGALVGGRLAVPAVLVAGLLAAPAALAGGPAPLVLAGGGPNPPLEHAPKRIEYSGDGSGFLAGRGASSRHPGNLQWTTQSSSQAVATGENWIDNCKPDCAAGKFSGYPATVLLSRPAVLGGHRVFTRMTVKYTGRRPPYGHGASLTARIKYTAQPDHTYFWNF